MTTDDATRARAETVARASYGRLMAILAARSGDIMAAEDALADAFARALEVWPERGVPERPEAWLLTTARNRMTDAQRRAVRMVVTDAPPEREAAMDDPEAIPDARLRLMFVCAHPALDAGLHTPLMLQTVLGLEAAEIGAAFLVPPAAMAQRLVRAKRKIRDARIPFAVPERAEMAPRLGAVLEAVYGAYAQDWLRPDDAGPLAALGSEALFLAELLSALLPEEPEALGLFALLSFIEARRGARTRGGRFVPLDAQDPADWDGARIVAAEAALARASAAGRLGRFQLEAAIQSVHAARRHGAGTDWRALSQLHAGLCQLYPTVGAAVGRAVAVAEDAGPEQGLAMLDRIDARAVSGFQPAWAARAHMLARLGDAEAARAAYVRAIALCTDPAVRDWLEARRAALGRGEA